MTASAYCTPADLYRYGLPRGSLPNPGRLVSAVSAAADSFTLDGHGFEADDELTFRAEEGGALPSPLSSGTVYYAIPLTDSTFKVAASAGGAAIELDNAGSYIVVTSSLPIQSAIERASALVDDMLPAHVVPLEAPYPVSVVAVCAELAISFVLSYTGNATASLTERLAATQKVLERWAKGVPIRGPIVPPAANLACKATRSATDPRGWSPSSGGLP